MNSVNLVLLVNGGIILALLIFSLAKREKSEGLKLFLFSGIVAAAAVTTIFLAADTIVKNQLSASKGPVHWHADFEIFVCGENPGETQKVQGQTRYLAHEEEEDIHPEEQNKAHLEKINLVDPTGLANRVGASDFHEHGDNRIHLEGVVTRPEDFTLAKFFEAIGGQLTPTLLRAPTKEGELIAQNGMTCPDGQKGTLQVFLYKTEGENIIQEKLSNFTDYVISPYGTVPPGDCLIFEFGPLKDKTENICNFYQIAIDNKEYRYGD